MPLFSSSTSPLQARVATGAALAAFLFIGLITAGLAPGGLN